MTRRASVTFLVNGPPSGPMGIRAEEFRRRLEGRYSISIAYRPLARGLASIVELVRALGRADPEVIYVVDTAYAGVVAAAIYKIRHPVRIVLDTGDRIFALARSAGLRGPVGLALTWLLERFAYRLADAIVVRGTRFRTMLAEEGLDSVVIQDGIDTRTFTQWRDGGLRAELGLEGFFTIGFLGSMVWSERLNIGYGWDLVEAVRLLKGERIKGVVLGSGTGVPILKARSRAYEIEDQMLFLDPVPQDDLPPFLAAVDVWLSTQTNDDVGNARTTGKLPLYLAAGVFVLASDVGEASLVLSPEQLVEYRGVVDVDYPSRLARRIRELMRHPERLAARDRNVEIARAVFDYDVLAERVDALLTSLVPEHPERDRLDSHASSAPAS